MGQEWEWKISDEAPASRSEMMGAGSSAAVVRREWWLDVGHILGSTGWDLLWI